MIHQKDKSCINIAAKSINFSDMKTHAPIYNPSFFFPLSVFFFPWFLGILEFCYSSSVGLSLPSCQKIFAFSTTFQVVFGFVQVFFYSLIFRVTIQSSINGSRILSTTSLAVVLKLYNEIDEIRHDDIRNIFYCAFYLKNIYLYLFFIFFYIFDCFIYV